MFYVLDRDGLTWRVKPISRNGKDFDIPRDYLQIDTDGWKKLQYKYGQKVYYDQGEPVAGPKSEQAHSVQVLHLQGDKGTPELQGTGHRHVPAGQVRGGRSMYSTLNLALFHFHFIPFFLSFFLPCPMFCFFMFPLFSCYSFILSK